jgi:RNA polymerase sigma factor (sigma-70 family)
MKKAGGRPGFRFLSDFQFGGFYYIESMRDDEHLLLQYATEHSDSAFAELVARYINLVYSTARRLAGPQAHLVEEIAQLVFIDLARKAATLPSGIILSGWLYRHTGYVAANLLRAERRRKRREETAMQMRESDENKEPSWERIAPHLDDGLNKLSRSDRDVIVLRFFKQQDLRTLGMALGISEDAAQKRVSRALTKLRSFLTRRGINLTVATLASVMGTEAVTAAPAGLAGSIATRAASIVATLGKGVSLGPLQRIAGKKLELGLVSILSVSIVLPLAVYHRGQVRLEAQDAMFPKSIRQLRAVTTSIQPAPELPITTILPNPTFGDLLKLRGQIGGLRARAQGLRKVAAFRNQDALLPREQIWPMRAKRLKSWLEEHPAETIPELAFLSDSTWLTSIYPYPMETDEECRRCMSILRANAEGRTINQLTKALRAYGRDNQGRFPSDFSQLEPVSETPLNDGILQRYTIVPGRSLVPELQSAGEWVITEKVPINETFDGRWAIGLASTEWVNESVTNRWRLLQ